MFIRDAVDGVKKPDEDGAIPTGGTQEYQSSDGYETPSELPVHAFAKALYPFKGKCGQFRRELTQVLAFYSHFTNILYLIYYIFFQPNLLAQSQ